MFWPLGRGQETDSESASVSRESKGPLRMEFFLDFKYIGQRP